ncbi:elongation factor G [Siccirubricoccus sp. KC 17139]|uniref:Elongation factor G n=1 Tax=Siccirubricoccus soli TaxID=2899147 RepID=A0ABT1D3X9_9PROT|nr:elongation factor G [Siccirubricoccus soli]MCO6416327.1 elongation factor G [Siccirubricoccus soli]MCP2682461.1 elongation factor G [Siccirubricoccus soli]
MPEDLMRSSDPGRGGGAAGPRCIALVGPQGSGKSTLFEALLAAVDLPLRRGAARASPGELRIAHAAHGAESWALLDCPGSVEFAHDAACALAVADLALVVAEPVAGRAAALGPIFRQIEAAGLPALLFLNKIDQFDGLLREMLPMLQAETSRRLLLRQVPIREDGAVTGYVDLVNERAYRYRSGEASERIPLPEAVRPREVEARTALLENLADHDDALLEKLLEEQPTEPPEIYRPLQWGEARGAVIGVLFGAAAAAGGIRRLWKALRHDTPGPAATAARLGIAAEGPPLAQIFRTRQAGHAGRLAWARLWRGPLRDGTTLAGQRIGGLYRAPGGELEKAGEGAAGEILALGRLEGVTAGTTLGGPPLPFPAPPAPLHALALLPEDRKDEVRLSAALQRLAEEDPALGLSLDAETGQTLLSGQGELHLRAALERLAGMAGVKLKTARPLIPYRESIRHGVVQHARLKRQTGGHGQFADVKLEITPRPRGAGFHFDEKVVGGAVPKRFIPAVAEAAEAATKKGPLGHPVVDVAVTLLDGTFHAVDSSDMAFATATRMAMQEGLAKAGPVLLEPVDHVTLRVPPGHAPGAQRLLTARRGQILGFATLEDEAGWETVEALVPEAELADLIIELRSQTQGLGSFTRRFDHLAEARGK